MKDKIEVLSIDANLLHLENVLFDLDNYKFDKDIIGLLNELKSLVDNKLFSKFNTENLDVIRTEYFVKFYLKK